MIPFHILLFKQDRKDLIYTIYTIFRSITYFVFYIRLQCLCYLDFILLDSLFLTIEKLVVIAYIKSGDQFGLR